MSLTPERLEQIRAMRFATSLNAASGHFATDEERSLYRLAAEHYNARLELLAEVDRLRAELEQVREAAAAARYYLGAFVHDSEDPGTGALGALHMLGAAGIPAERSDLSEQVMARHVAAAVEKALAARPTRAEVLEEVADTLVAACPDHGERSECRMTCACDVAAELRMDAAGHPVHEAPVLPWLPLLDDEDRDSLAVALEEEVCGGTDNVMRSLENLLSRYRRSARPAPAADGGAR
jgi:hypothetical protein